MSDKEFYTCPYDSSHRIHRTRMARHLLKCKINHRNVNVIVCPYNKLHVLDPYQYEYHLTVCEERKNFENFVYETENKQLDTSFPEVQNIKFSRSSENWDNSGNVVSYHSHLVQDGVTNPTTRRQEALDRNED
ncbi:PREDICTED: gametocyte-specific factor 1-like [Polistes dominula]|uniref:Gametocyte-specific factor 1-like n=1 Tax=Polistes dominula TaxID=743375 RepID=A0ABM1J6W5_POLDO|nr:PREDICTED: gametocyte-specific factor 1-like [Polistes dominula]